MLCVEPVILSLKEVLISKAADFFKLNVRALAAELQVPVPGVLVSGSRNSRRQLHKTLHHKHAHILIHFATCPIKRHLLSMRSTRLKKGGVLRSQFPATSFPFSFCTLSWKNFYHAILLQLPNFSAVFKKKKKKVGEL